MSDDVERLLQRPVIRGDSQRIGAFVRGRTVIVTGAAGSIGSELCRLLAEHGVDRLVAVDNSECALYRLTQDIPSAFGYLVDVRDRDGIRNLFDRIRPDIVFHAAALKHVPILEERFEEGIKTNVFGTVNVADEARRWNATMVMISTDKAVEPVSMLGATKRLAEMYCRVLNLRPIGRFVCVRFGNVLASNGSVVPKFAAQIMAGGPVTVTHPEMRRYLMTIREACDLAVMAARCSSDASVFVLRMGEQVRILDIAERMIAGRDIPITFTGMRPGERLEELLIASDETAVEMDVDGISAVTGPLPMTLGEMHGLIYALEQAIQNGNHDLARCLLWSSVRSEPMRLTA